MRWQPATRNSDNGTSGGFAGIAGSIRFNARELHHLASLFSLFGDELAEALEQFTSNMGRRLLKKLAQ